jgi:hypothetical protein
LAISDSTLSLPGEASASAWDATTVKPIEPAALTTAEAMAGHDAMMMGVRTDTLLMESSSRAVRECVTCH